MADPSQFAVIGEVKISELPVAPAVNADDQLETNQAGVSRSITVGQITAPYAPLDSPTFIGVPKGPTPIGPTPGDQLVTATWVQTQINSFGYAPLASPLFTGDPRAPTPATADNDISIATTAFVKAQGYATTTYVDAADALKAPLASPTFTGDPKAPTPSVGDNDTSIATTAHVINVLNAAAFAPLASPAFSGNPTAPTPATSDNDTTVATTAMVQAAITAALASVGVIPTGAVLDLLGTVAAPTGWVLGINGTIGNAASGATIRANADCANLFTHLWTLADTEAPVSGGRGASAAADFAANKTIGGLDCRGAARATFDSLGGAAAGRLTTLFPRVGMIAGAQTHTLSTAELASHGHGVTDPGHAHNLTQGASGPTTYTSRAAFGDGTSAGNYSGVVNPGGTGITIQNTGSGTAHNNVQATRTVTTIIKL